MSEMLRHDSHACICHTFLVITDQNVHNASRSTRSLSILSKKGGKGPEFYRQKLMRLNCGR